MTNNETIEIRRGISHINFNDLAKLYLDSGLGQRDPEVLSKSFANSYKVITVYVDKNLLGAGRMLSDGFRYGMIFDVAVQTKQKKKGIGRKIMDALLEGERDKFIHLTSTFGHEDFYKKLGFRRHKNAYALYPATSDYLE